MNVRVPADVDMADRIVAGLTARQIAILAGHGLALWALWLGVGKRVPIFAFGIVAFPLAVFGMLWATTPIEGTTLERLASAAARHLLAPRRRVLAPEGIPALPDWAREDTGRLAPLDLPAKEVADDGCVSLGAGGTMVICRASSVNFALRSTAEQRALIDAFGRLLNALDAPAQFVVRSGRADVRSVIAELEEHAAALPHPALEAAAREHATFLGSLAERADVLHRDVLVCLRDPSGEQDARSRLDRRVSETEELLRALGIRLIRLGSTEASEVLAAACDPEARIVGSVSAVVEGRW